MKKLQLQSDSYRILISAFKDWLDILGYAESTVYYLPNHLQEFFYWLECQGHTDLRYITVQDVTKYYGALQERANQRQEGGLSKSYLNKHQQALKKFREYLIQHNAQTPLRVHLRSESNPTEEKTAILTQSEIKSLFAATNYSHNDTHYQLRDKAILVLCYSCGLRRTEAVNLDIKDILFDKERVYVRKSKNYKERFVPLNRYNLKILEDYVFEARPEFYNASKTEALLISRSGKRLDGKSMSNRLQTIIKSTSNPTIIAKEITLHTLRHSIATHLLQKEVPLESIKTFLGHTSLESTQIYTHLAKQDQ